MRSIFKALLLPCHLTSIDSSNSQIFFSSYFQAHWTQTQHSKPSIIWPHSKILKLITTQHTLLVPAMTGSSLLTRPCLCISAQAVPFTKHALCPLSKEFSLSRLSHTLFPLLWTELCPPPQIHMLTLTPLMWTVFGDRAFTEVVKVKWDYEGRGLIE